MDVWSGILYFIIVVLNMKLCIFLLHYCYCACIIYVLSTRNVQKLRAKAVATCGELVFLASIVIGQNMVPKKYLKPALKRANAKVRFILFIHYLVPILQHLC